MGAHKEIFRRGVTETSLTASDLGTPGEKRIESDGKVYRLVSAGATLPSTQAILQLDSVSGSTWGVETVIASDVIPFALHTVSHSLAISAYFWAMAEGTVVADTTILDSTKSFAQADPLCLGANKKLVSMASANPMYMCAHYLSSASRESEVTTDALIYFKGFGA